jgi:hypothetical protein
MNTSPMKRVFVAAAVALLVFSAGCKRKAPQPAAAPRDFVVAVAPFSNPRADFELLAGYLPENVAAVSEGIPGKLDESLSHVMSGTVTSRVLAPSKIEVCLKTEPRPQEGGRQGTLKYWQNIGRCVGAQYLVVPQVIAWREREGSAMGTTVTAAVIINFYLVDVNTGGVVKFYHFDEEQRSLSDNLLDAGKFFSRKGRWLTASELAEEGMRAAMAEFRL